MNKAEYIDTDRDVNHAMLEITSQNLTLESMNGKSKVVSTNICR